ncbi:hypothetical protein C9374_010614 [Naegleria lovaniensis]|uniref:Uncharacterized protein n=1 Tax=Naegleria lovaniensis TaxID=51637 RepID=A0AA88GBD4_NAELO|nr:uncharacterized protein C9374_010614 [Naegleria lovaniensis]KAG2374595.1 hypothetical protein C9374_010614 [Naegleria lovaniensis]
MVRFNPWQLLSDKSIHHEHLSKVIQYPLPNILYSYEGSSISDNSLKTGIQYSIKFGSYTSKIINQQKHNLAHGLCRGCYQCPEHGCNQTAAKSAHRAICSVHQKEMVLFECVVQFKYFKNEISGKQFLFCIGEHLHHNPPPSKVSTEEKELLEHAFHQNPTLTAKQVTRGVGVPFIPGAQNRALINGTRIQRIRRKAMSTKFGSTSNFASILASVEENLLPSLTKNLADECLFGMSLSDGFGSWVQQVQFCPKIGFLMFPISRHLMEHVDMLVIDMKHQAKSGPFLNHLGISTFFEHAKGGMCFQLCRFLIEREDYKTCFRMFLDALESGGLDLKELFVGNDRRIKSILVDFSQSQLKDYGRLLWRNLEVLRSVKRMVKVIPVEEAVRTRVEGLASDIEKFRSEKAITTILDAIELYCPGVKSWCDWWRQSHIVKLLLATSAVENNLPRNTNVQEVLNATGVPTYDGNAIVEIEMMLREDVTGVIKLLGLNENVPLSYADNTKQGRKKRNEKRKRADPFDSRPADTVSRGLIPTNTAPIDALENFLEGLKTDQRTALEEFAGQEADDVIEDEDFQEVGDGEIVEVTSEEEEKVEEPKAKKKKGATTRTTSRKSKIITDSESEYSSSSSNDVLDEVDDGCTARTDQIVTRSSQAISFEPGRSFAFHIEQATKFGRKSANF